MKKLIELTVNGEHHEVAVTPEASLLNVLRGDLGLVGPKKGCDAGSCGCCSVHVDGKVVYSCMTYAVGAQGKEITTVEGIGHADDLHPLQQAFIDAGAVQCGYCTSGILMAAKQLLDTTPKPDEETIRHAIAGNLCRCTGYAKIVDAIKLAADRL
ncbi:MAG: (2Fe-2S)-binding protein [Chromatiales bacterium]|nr:MAG: (2Fe-2S)-binding protein [Chromatiales bacterium]